jgi:hypothetical protein
MGLMSTVKGWLNIGGVKLKFKDFKPNVSKSGNEIKGKVLLTSKGDKQVLKLGYKFVLERTSGRGDEKETKEHILAQAVRNEPFEMKTGETKELEFVIPYSYDKSLKDMGGVLGAIGKIGAFASAQKDEYFIIASCSVKGAAFDTKDKVQVTLVE